MTAGVQNFEPAAYLPAPSSAPASDSKSTATADGQTAQSKDETSDFQSELQLHDSDSTKENKGGKQIESADRSEIGSKLKKKRDSSAPDPDLSAAAPVQVAEPPKKVLPVALTVTQPEENVKPQENAQPDEQHVTSVARIEALASAEGLLQSAPVPQSPELQKSAGLQQSSEEPSKRIPFVSADPSITLDSSNIPVVLLAPDVPAQDQAPKAADQPAEAIACAESQPVSAGDARLPAPPPEPVVAAVQETVDSASASPSALAFAARMTVAPQKAEPSVSENSSQPPAVAGSATLARIPVRYAATAQILSSSEVPSKDEIAAIDRPVRIDARTDMVLPRIETTSEAAPGPGPAAPQQAEPTARTERVIEPPAAPPTSSHDIRVRVPDNNGGSTQVRFIESGGEVRVSVRSSDADLAQSLRGHLNDLTQRLAEEGIPAEIWKPASSETSSQNNQHQPDRDGRGSGGQQPGGQGGQQDRQEKRPAWLEQMEASLHAEVQD